MRTCQFCTRKLHPWLEDDHHLVKRSKGGQDFIDNQAGICVDCHRLTHEGEMLVRKGKNDDQILAVYREIFSGNPDVDVEVVIRNLLQAAKIAAKENYEAERKVIPIELKVPTQLLKDFTLKAKDLNVSRNNLILWAMNELVSGRTLLPKT